MLTLSQLAKGVNDTKAVRYVRTVSKPQKIIPEW